MPTMLPGHEDGGEELNVSIPLGGPIYVPDSVGPLTRVPDFETSVFQELQSLKEELYGDSTEICDEEISVDELKIIGEDELVSKAFEEAFKDDELAIDASQVKNEHLNPDDNDASVPHHGCPQNSEADTMAIVSSESSTALPLKVRGQKSNKNPPGKGQKRKHGSKNIDSFNESYIAKVEELAKIKLKQEEDKATVRLHSFDSRFTKAEKIKSLKSSSVSTKVRAASTSSNLPLHFPETVLCCEVYHNRKTWLKTQEFLVLGRQFLTEVRDKIYCLTDEIMKKAGQHDPSGYFLIEDVFCNDMREASATDYSKPILDWLKDSKNEALEKWEIIVSGELQQKQKALLGGETKQSLPSLKSLHMQTTRFCDVRFRLGAGYLYCHQGDCKHVIVIRDMRLIHPEDIQSRDAYPLITYQAKFLHKKCSVCKIYKAEKMTVDDKWAPSNPCYFCEVCYYMLHYADGSLLYNDFDVYDYHHG
ncbi:hypothetical protein ABFS82_08G157700 [Erythranthe guttata]|uniref:snRNA-activating protein complex subunit n=1 Tax=Erythranthe guttata TaxID=4155 RepID=UPI00064DB61E|nr:PREDICTED: snRNA-activating protein complex subunit [Erythranthe guttata]XP_012841924.1 PREDICTED: snRNA-activating protein complex subunit [Erythranthe guttata]|eukprot:XP_012841923.1 PREDICTED: snRNA-activating protein complex subunit [Erythranthe guttata]